MKIVRTKINATLSFVSIDSDSLSLGCATPFDIYIKKDKDFVIIIEAGTLLTPPLLEKLKKHKELYIKKEDEEKQELSCTSLKYYIRHNRDDITRRLHFIYDVNSKLFEKFMESKENKIDIGCAELIIDAILYLLKYDSIFIKHTMPYLINDFKLQNHSLHVAIYALSLGYALKLKDNELLKLGLAALLHDVGIKKVDPLIISKTSQLSVKEMESVQKHPLYSIEIVKQNKILDPYIIDAIMHHHECYDATGYPEGRPKEEISVFASILAICDVFDALTNNRPHRREYTSFDALRMMMRDTDMVNKFNQDYLHIALKLL